MLEAVLLIESLGNIRVSDWHAELSAYMSGSESSAGGGWVIVLVQVPYTR